MTRSMFNLSHEHKLSCDMGQLIPVMAQDVLPGDTMICNHSALVRVAPLQHPLMHRVELRLHSFYVPNRILWDGWEDFITGEDDTTPIPSFTTAGGEALVDHLGVPPTAGIVMDALPIRAYNMIWNEFYRDQDLQPEVTLDSGNIQNCAWQKDYFTIARPTPQQGDPEPIPLSGYGRIPVTSAIEQTDAQLLNDGNYFYAQGATVADGLSIELTAGSVQIDDLRRSIALQRFAEARMRFGSRYVDYLRYIGVNPSDGRLDRPEYLGGGKEILNFSEVLSTAQTTDTGVGDMYGHGIGMGRTRRWRKTFEEHGWVLTLMSARPKTVYQNAIPRKFTRYSAMDYWQKEMEVLPWQEVRQNEVHSGGSPDIIFGYVPKYEEYRHGMSCVSGTLRGGTENDWHMAREFATPPDPVNASFVNCTPTDRIYQDANMPELIVNVMSDVKAMRYVGETATMGVDL